MPVEFVQGALAHVAGTFDLTAKSGTIDYVTPVKAATTAVAVAETGIYLVGEDAQQHRLFDKAVSPQRNSCAPNAEQGTFEETVPVSPDLQKIRLLVGGNLAAEYVRGQPAAAAAVALGAPDPNKPHRMSLVPDAAAAPRPGVTYSVQAKAGEAPWQTLAVGLPTPDTQIDANQFPGTRSLEVRVLQSDGFTETEVFRDTKRF